MKNRIIQWNCRGLKSNYNDILLLLNEHDPAVLCLLETFLKDTDKTTFKNYSSYNTTPKLVTGPREEFPLL
jgi:exonuclease III